MARRKRKPGAIVPGIPDPNFTPVTLDHAKEGWRAWSVSREMPAYGLVPKLKSVSATYTWQPKRKAEAECDHCASIPGLYCRCGFYSAKSLKHLMQMGYHTYGDIDESKEFKIVGQVACWGRVVEGTQGWRSQYCYPVYLMLPFEMGADFGKVIRDAYGCKVRLLNFLKPREEIDDAFIAGLLSGQPQLKMPVKETRRGRRVAHKKLRFVGRTASDDYVLDDKRVVDVIWTVSPDKAVPVLVDHLEFEPR